MQIHLSQKYFAMSNARPASDAASAARSGPGVMLLLLSFWLLLGAVPGHAAEAPALQSDSGKPSAGYFRLTWDWPESGNRRFELQESGGRQFEQAETIYQGPDRATVRSGLPDGAYYYRVRLHPESGQPGPWSEPVTVEVEHHSQARAALFFALGALVFLATLALVVGGNRKMRAQENG